MNKIVNFFKFLGLFLSWAGFGFGERLRNYIITLTIILVAFALMFYFSPNHFEIIRGNSATSELERFVHYCYISVNIITSLDMGGMVPKTIAARLCLISEVILGYIMLAALVSIIIKRITER